MKTYNKNGQFITRADRQNKKQIRLALLIGFGLIVMAIVFNIKVYL